MLSGRGNGFISLEFMSQDHPSPPGPETCDGQGMIMTFEVDDAAKAHERR